MEQFTHVTASFRNEMVQMKAFCITLSSHSNQTLSVYHIPFNLTFAVRFSARVLN